MVSLLKKTAAISALLIATSASMATAQVTTVINPALNDKVSLNTAQGPVSGSIDIASNKSTVLQFDTAVGHSLIANPSIADIIPMTDQSIYLLGKQKGTTSLTLFDKNSKLLGVFDLNVSHDVATLKQRLYQMSPNDNIEVRASGGSLVLSGEVSDSNVAARAAQIAEQFAPGAVLNTLSTPRSQQVMLSVKIAEVQRSATKALGINTNLFYNQDAGGLFGLSGNQDRLGIVSGILDPDAYIAGVANIQLGSFDLQVLFDALEEKGVLSTLAEPTLVAVSGETANFLAGGEFPVPVASDSDDGQLTTTISFKEFGVKLAYTPTVVGDTINLVIEPEVSVLDPANGIVSNDLVIPGLVTRRAKTTVDLKNGQSFAIAGLLQETFDDNIQQIPWLSSIPILGALARSTNYQKRESELVIVVTPYIVEPYEGSDYNLPTDNFVQPSEGDLFLNGTIEGTGPLSSGYAKNNGTKLAASGTGTTDGTTGYIVK